jgi:hypothetical protein
MHQLNSTKRARVTSNAIHLPGSRILHYVRFRYPIEQNNLDLDFSRVSTSIGMITIVWFASTAIFFISQYNLRVSKIKNHYFILSYLK